jgi:hypothetical protein
VREAAGGIEDGAKGWVVGAGCVEPLPCAVGGAAVDDEDLCGGWLLRGERGDEGFDGGALVEDRGDDGDGDGGLRGREAGPSATPQNDKFI